METRKKTKPKIKKSILVIVSLFFGFSFGFFIYSFWLTEFIPPLSRRIIAFTALISVIGSIGNFYLLNQLILPAFSEMRGPYRNKSIGLIALVGVLVLWFGLEGRMSESKYPVFLLPRQNLEISVPLTQEPYFTGIEISWFKTSLGEVSFNSIEYDGWERVNDLLVLRNPSNNALTWSGPVGKEAIIVFNSFPHAGKVNVSWNGDSEIIDLFSVKEGDFIYRNHFEVPFYASPIIPLFLGFLQIFTGFFGVFCLLMNSYDEIEKVLISIEKSLLDDLWAKYDIFIISGLLCLTLLLRVAGLENLYPFMDEYSHLLAAKKIILGTLASQVPQRSFYIVTLPVVLYFKTFGIHLWSARLAGVLFNSLAIIPLYLIAKKINRQIAILSCLLYATSPWVIAVARNIREYGYYPFYFYWIVYAMVVFLSQIPDRFVLLRDWKKIIKPENAVLLLFLIFPIIYSRFIDPFSTFKTVMSSYLVFGIFLIKKVNWINRGNIWSAVIVLLVLFAGYRLFLHNARISPNVNLNNAVVQEIFFFTSPTQWFYKRSTIVIGLALFSLIIFSIYYQRYSEIPLFLTSLFFVSAVFFIFKFAHYIRPRYFFHLQIWYIVPVAIGLYALWVFLQILIKAAVKRIFKKPILREYLAVVFASVVLIMNFNFPQILLPSIYKDNGYMPITTEYHYDMGPVHEYISAHAKEGDVLIYTVYGNYARWIGEPEFAGSFYYNYTRKDKQEFIFSLIEDHPSGWIVLDKWRGEAYSNPLPFESFSVGGKEVSYMGIFVDEHVWWW